VAQDEIRLLLEEELARESPPPLGDLVEASVRQGRRMRRTRNVWTAGGGAVALACLMVGVFVVVNAVPRGTSGTHLGFGGGQQPGAAPAESAAPQVGTDPATAAAPSSAASSASSKAAGSAGKARATPQAMLELLSQLLPQGRRSAPARVSDGTLMVALNLDRGRGFGMVRVGVHSAPPPAPTRCQGGSTCRTLPDKSFVQISDLPDNCIEHQVVFLSRPDGVGIEILLSSCLSWNGTTNPPSQVVLSVDEAIAIADDPRWGTEMPQSLVEGGQRDFPNLSTFS